MALLIGGLLTVFALALVMARAPAQADPAGADGARVNGAPKPTIVLVHGAWADASSWNGEVGRLQRDGYVVRAIDNPLLATPTAVRSSPTPPPATPT